MKQLHVSPDLALPIGIAKRHPKIVRDCAHCGRPFGCFVSQNPRFCSRACKGLASRRQVAISCPQCGAEFRRKPSELTGPGPFYCSRLCLHSSRPATRSYKKRGYRHEHRVIAEEMLGRPLRTGEVVHHKDGNRHNNARTNLEVMSRSAHASLTLSVWATRRGDRTPHQKKVSASSRVHYALSRGVLVRPDLCEVCKRPGVVRAHHEDYDRPLDVIWLCGHCHRGVHMGQLEVSA